MFKAQNTENKVLNSLEIRSYVSIVAINAYYLGLTTIFLLELNHSKPESLLKATGD